MGFQVGGDWLVYTAITGFILFGLGEKLGSFGILVSASLAKELGSARRFGFLGFVGFGGFTKRTNFVVNKRLLGFDRQTGGTTRQAVGRMAPMGLGRREALLFLGDEHRSTF
jgi:hypothetical protein